MMDDPTNELMLWVGFLFFAVMVAMSIAMYLDSKDD